MANTKQAAKRARQAEKHRINNRWQLTRMNTHLKRVLVAIDTKNHENAMKEYREMSSVVDRLASKGLIHRNKAARHKSRLNAKIKALVLTAA